MDQTIVRKVSLRKAIRQIELANYFQPESDEGRTISYFGPGLPVFTHWKSPWKFDAIYPVENA